MNPIQSQALIISADDYGMSDAIDAGILDLIARDRVSATACMVNSPRWPQAAQPLRIVPATKVAIGLHLDLTEFGEGALPLKQLITASLLRRLDGADLRTRIDAQFARFEEAIGRAPDYVDGHQHVHQLPQVRTALLDVLAARSLKPWLRISAPPWRPWHGDGLKRAVIRFLGARALASAARKRGLATTDRLLGVYAFDADDARYLNLLGRWLHQLSTRSALMCHPAERVDAADALGHARHTEYCVLAGAAFGHLLATGRIRLATHPDSHQP